MVGDGEVGCCVSAESGASRPSAVLRERRQTRPACPRTALSLVLKERVYTLGKNSVATTLGSGETHLDVKGLALWRLAVHLSLVVRSLYQNYIGCDSERRCQPKSAGTSRGRWYLQTLGLIWVAGCWGIGDNIPGLLDGGWMVLPWAMEGCVRKEEKVDQREVFDFRLVFALSSDQPDAPAPTPVSGQLRYRFRGDYSGSGRAWVEASTKIQW